MSAFSTVQDVAFRAVAAALARQPLSPGKVAFAWRAAVGPAMAKATEAAMAGDRVVRVRAVSTHWRLEVERARPLIEARLSRLLGSRVEVRLDQP